MITNLVTQYRTSLLSFSTWSWKSVDSLIRSQSTGILSSLWRLRGSPSPCAFQLLGMSASCDPDPFLHLQWHHSILHPAASDVPAASLYHLSGSLWLSWNYPDNVETLSHVCTIPFDLEGNRFTVGRLACGPLWGPFDLLWCSFVF